MTLDELAAALGQTILAITPQGMTKIYRGLTNDLLALAQKQQARIRELEEAVRKLRYAVSDVLVQGEIVKPENVDDAIVELLLLVDVTANEEQKFRERHNLPGAQAP